MSFWKMMLCSLALASAASALAYEEQVLWRAGDNGIASYRIPAIVTAPNGDLVAACDARMRNAGDLDRAKEINISIRRSTDGGKTWTDPVYSYEWPWTDEEHWAGSDPSMIVDTKVKKIFLFYNVWESKKQWGIYKFYVQESSDNGKTWSKPRDISEDIAFPEWPFGKLRNKGGFIFISSGTGIQTKDGTLLHTLVHVGDGNALFGSTDHGKTWKPIGTPAKNGDECKVVELNNGSWMINSRWKGGGRQIHVSKDKGNTWESYYDTNLQDPQCNAQIMRVGKVLLFSNCKAGNRSNLHLRASKDDGKTWTDGILVHQGGAAYSDITILKDKKTVGILYENGGNSVNSIVFATVPLADVKAQLDQLGK